MSLDYYESGDSDNKDDWDAPPCGELTQEANHVLSQCFVKRNGQHINVTMSNPKYFIPVNERKVGVYMELGSSINNFPWEFYSTVNSHHMISLLILSYFVPSLVLGIIGFINM